MASVISNEKGLLGKKSFLYKQHLMTAVRMNANEMIEVVISIYLHISNNCVFQWESEKA